MPEENKENSQINEPVAEFIEKLKEQIETEKKKKKNGQKKILKKHSRLV